ncbi:MAG: helix-turn-helix transcriptional regulator [Methanomassiliicoccus sp.]|nr:helix-turn-helix transcriptional regulator [Methanomassiliicoccus sp.]
MKTTIKENRARVGMTQEQLADKVGVRRETIVFLEKGKYNPSLRLAHDVAKALGVRIDDLFSFDDEAGPSGRE